MITFRFDHCKNLTNFKTYPFRGQIDAFEKGVAKKVVIIMRVLMLLIFALPFMLGLNNCRIFTALRPSATEAVDKRALLLFLSSLVLPAKEELKHSLVRKVVVFANLFALLIQH